MKRKTVLNLCLAVGVVCIMLMMSGCSSLLYNIGNVGDIGSGGTTGQTGTTIFSDEAKVATLKNWQFQYNEGTSDFSVFFALLDSDEKALAVSGYVDIRIEDEESNVLYTGTKSFTAKDFGTYTSESRGEQYLANVKIDENEVAEGSSKSGKVYLTVYGDKYYSFDEVNCDALYCLPVKDITLLVDTLPQIVVIEDYSGDVSKIEIDEVVYECTTIGMEITISGTKLSGDDDSYDTVKYKIYDSEGYVTDSGSVFLLDISVGDKFKKDSIYFYDAKPGENYTIKFFGE